MTASTLPINSAMYKKVSYDAIKDFAPITLADRAERADGHPSLPAKSLTEFIALAKQEPGNLTYGHAGIGTSPHMCMELFKSMAGVDLQHVPYPRHRARRVTEVMSGQIHAMFSNTLSAMPHIEAGKVRALACHRQALGPDAGYPGDR